MILTYERFLFFKEKANNQKKDTFLSEAWKKNYLSYKEKLKNDIKNISNFAYQQVDCRMQRLSEALGEEEEKSKPCFNCDLCCPERRFFTKQRFLKKQDSNNKAKIIDYQRKP